MGNDAYYKIEGPGGRRVSWGRYEGDWAEFKRWGKGGVEGQRNPIKDCLIFSGREEGN